MKKLVLLSAIAISGLIYNTAKAQFSVHVGVNLFPHRVLVAPRVDVDAPVYTDVNYENNDDYYYLPDVNAYYNVDQQCYYYFDGDNWIAADYLPGEYHDFDWTTARRYEIRAPRPYMHNDVYFNRFRGNGDIAFNRDHSRGRFDGSFNRYQDRGPQQFANNNRGPQFGDRRDDHFNNSGPILTIIMVGTITVAHNNLTAGIMTGVNNSNKAKIGAGEITVANKTTSRV